MNVSRWIVVPIAAAVVFAVGCGIAALFRLVWPTMPAIAWWGVPVACVVMYLLDAMRRERA